MRADEHTRRWGVMLGISRTHRAARAYAERFAWRVFPLVPRNKVPLISRSRGGRGYLDATNAAEQIDQWWKEEPQANIGLACGLCGLTVVDIDPRSEGDATWADLSHARVVPDTAEGATGGGGRHLFFRGEATSCVLGPGLEIKAGGGYVVLPPSIHPNEKQYGWELSSRVDEVPIAPLPEWLTQLIANRKHSEFSYAHASSVDPASFAVGAAFRTAGMLGRELRPGVFAAICPNRSEHSTGKDFDGSTVVFAPPPGKLRGWFHCSHAHCEGVVS